MIEAKTLHIPKYLQENDQEKKDRMSTGLLFVLDAE